jgi:hypothetical protein
MPADFHTPDGEYGVAGEYYYNDKKSFVRLKEEADKKNSNRVSEEPQNCECGFSPDCQPDLSFLFDFSEEEDDSKEAVSIVAFKFYFFLVIGLFVCSFIWFILCLNGFFLPVINIDTHAEMKTLPELLITAFWAYWFAAGIALFEECLWWKMWCRAKVEGRFILWEIVSLLLLFSPLLSVYLSFLLSGHSPLEESGVAMMGFLAVVIMCFVAFRWCYYRWFCPTSSPRHQVQPKERS